MGDESGWRFAPDPEVAAAYAAVCDIVAEENLPVDVDEPGCLRPAPVTPMQTMAACEPAYTVKLVVNQENVCVSRTGRWGIGGTMTFVDYPVPPGAAGFRDRLAAVLVPRIRHELTLAADTRAADLAQNGPFAAYEAVDAVQPLA
ncbi:hypothetical protein [Amycolatopsis sp. NPDC004079]|uniref:hypothetical protein n=1 Tax=Amycolatopsis sp. NPDC004079 TaxID=3154549 RepID=UPI0033A094F2